MRIQNLLNEDAESIFPVKKGGVKTGGRSTLHDI